MSRSYLASGDIYPCRFVKLHTVDGQVVAADATTDRIIGVSQEATRRSDYLDTSGKAAADGEPILVYELGDECKIALKGTVAPGDKLTANGSTTTSGGAVATVTDHNHYGAQAMQNGVTGEIIKARVVTGQVSL